MSNPPNAKPAAIQAPSGTRDFYPLELARRRWIEDKWRKVAVRHGFEEIDGPTFEETELYTRKSGDGIVGEIFGVYSGKDEAAVKKMGERLAAGERGAIAPFALRPEFTPTLARMYAARAKQLPQPCKWFWQQNCFRAERPQRGRLREFWQWNCDIIGSSSESSNTDAEIIACCVDLLVTTGLKPSDVRVHVNSRELLSTALVGIGIAKEGIPDALTLLDQRGKLPLEKWNAAAAVLGLNLPKLVAGLDVATEALDELARKGQLAPSTEDKIARAGILLDPLLHLYESLLATGCGEFLDFQSDLARGLAYYTGMVFEVIVDGERAVAGGGRYDNLIETFGGPPTPAVGFGMGDVVLSLVLQDKGLMPSDKQIAADLGLRPDVFVISNEENTALVAPLVAQLRREGKHARRSYKATRNVGKLLQDANAAGARFAVIIESPTEITLKDMDANTQDRGPAAELLKRITPP
jgi:histidyl-tRNA synthetase